MVKQNKDTYSDCWIYILLLTTLTILLESLKPYTFKVLGVDLTFALFLLPFTYFIANYILKKYDYKKSISAVAVSAVIFVCYSVMISFTIGEKFILSSVSGELCAYIVSQYVSLTIYYFLMNNTKSPSALIFLNYMFALIVYYMFYTIINLSRITMDTYWTGYFITILFQGIICIIITVLDKKIKRGQEK